MPKTGGSTSVSIATTTTDGGGVGVRYAPNDTPSRNWDEPSFSPVAGYPGAVAFHEQRLWFGGTPGQPNGLWASKIGQYFNFSAGEGLDTDAIWVTLGGTDVSTVRHIVSSKSLEIYTATGEWATPITRDSSLTPANFAVKRQGSYGAQAVPPRVFDGGTLFLQDGGRALREFVYSQNQETFASADLSVVASHLLNAPVELDVAYGNGTRGEQYAYVLNSDGTVAMFHSNRTEKLAAWALWSLSGGAVIESLCTVGTQVFVVVLRGGVRSLEVFNGDREWTLDAGATLSAVAVATTTWTVPAAYSGKTFKVVQGSRYLGQFTASGTTLTLPTATVGPLLIGYDFDVEIRDLPPKIDLPNGSLHGQMKRINKVLLQLNRSVDVRVRGTQLSFVGLNEAVPEDVTGFDETTVRFDDPSTSLDDTDQAAAAAGTYITGVRQFFVLGYHREPVIRLTQNEPVPLRVLAMVTEVGF